MKIHALVCLALTRENATWKTQSLDVNVSQDFTEIIVKPVNYL